MERGGGEEGGRFLHHLKYSILTLPHTEKENKEIKYVGELKEIVIIIFLFLT